MLQGRPLRLIFLGAADSGCPRSCGQQQKNKIHYPAQFGSVTTLMILRFSRSRFPGDRCSRDRFARVIWRLVGEWSGVSGQLSSVVRFSGRLFESCRLSGSRESASETFGDRKSRVLLHVELLILSSPLRLGISRESNCRDAAGLIQTASRRQSVRCSDSGNNDLYARYVP